MNTNEQGHGCSAADCNCTPIAAPRSLDWSDMLALACRQVGKFAVYGNYTARPEEDDQALEKLTLRFFQYCDAFGMDKLEQQRMLQDLMFGNAVLFDTSEEAGRIFRFFLEKGIDSGPFFACLVSPTEGIVSENT